MTTYTSVGNVKSPVGPIDNTQGFPTAQGIRLPLNLTGPYNKMPGILFANVNSTFTLPNIIWGMKTGGGGGRQAAYAI